GIPRTINPAPPVVLARHAERESIERAVVRIALDSPAGAMPDLRGLSARDAVRTLLKLGVTPRISGDGFVVLQDPPPGSPLEPTSACRLVLGRDPASEKAPAAR